MPSDIPDLTSHLGYWLRQLSNHVSGAFARKLASRDVSVADWVLMRMLHGEAPMAPSRLAERMGLTRGAVTKIGDRLAARGLVVRRANAADKRAQTLGLTEAGSALVPELAALADLNEAECFSRLSADERLALERLLRRASAELGLSAAPLH